jgi:hypothetical protein
MVPLSAEILTERVSIDERAAVRRSLRLGVQTHRSGNIAMALILNISETGLLIETVVKLEVGETLHVEIPEASASTARVVWTEALLAGCEFVNPLSARAVSAAQLKSPISTAEGTGEGSPFASDRSGDVDPWDYDEASIQTAIVIVTSLISVMALLIFLAAVLPL